MSLGVYYLGGLAFLVGGYLLGRSHERRRKEDN